LPSGSCGWQAARASVASVKVIGRIIMIVT
jgi:hypothetical protein